jgi:hypothetical protein
MTYVGKGKSQERNQEIMEPERKKEGRNGELR